MVQLERSMMERYEIKDNRPESAACVIFGADKLMLGAAARMLDEKNTGCLCVTPAAETLNKQDGMFTLLVRGETIEGKRIMEERVVQSIVKALDPEKDYEELRKAAADEKLSAFICHQDATDAETAIIALMLYERFRAGIAAPHILLFSDMPQENCIENLCAAVKFIASKWDKDAAFAPWLDGAAFTRVLCETLSGPLTGSERESAWKKFNYKDEMVAWTEPNMAFAADENAPEFLKAYLSGEKYETACEKKKRIFDTAVFISACTGYICGMNTYAEVMKDEGMRGLIAHAFFDEILPLLPWGKDEIAPYVITSFERLENPMNAVPLMDIARDMLKNFPETVLKSIAAYADKTFEAPRCLSLALSAAIMLYAGARQDENGRYKVVRENASHVIADDEEILESFARFSHDMPPETLAYAALADRSCWGADLRDIDGLEMRVAYDLAAIQRIGMRETVKLTLLEYEE